MKCEFRIGKKVATHTKFSSTLLHFLVLDGNSKYRTAEHYNMKWHFFLLPLSKSLYMYTPRYHRVLAVQPIQCLFPQFHRE